MSQGISSFWNILYFVPDSDNWHLTEEIKKEFDKYMKESEENERTVI